MDNLELWSKVCKTDPKHTKKANVKGNKITAIAPQYQIMNATEQFGAYGKEWGFKDIELDYSMLDKTGIVVFKGLFFYPTNCQFPIISSIGAYKDSAMLKPDTDFAKKVETDALTKALSKLGFNADVFMGRFDDNKYIAEMNEEFKNIGLTGNDKSWIASINSGSAKLEDIVDANYRRYIEENLENG